MPTSISSRSLARTGVRALDSQTYPSYIHHSTPKINRTRTPAATDTSWDSSPVSWVMAKTKTRSKNSSSVLTRSGSALSLLLAHSPAAMSPRYQPPRICTVPASS